MHKARISNFINTRVVVYFNDNEVIAGYLVIDKHEPKRKFAILNDTNYIRTFTKSEIKSITYCNNGINIKYKEIDFNWNYYKDR